MKIDISEKKKNPLQERTEVRFTVDHSTQATPNRKELVNALAKELGVKNDQVILNNLDSMFGRAKSKGYAKVYDSKESAMKFEREYLLKRNGIGAEAPKGE
jgi:small subunit ribosomal protein S24e